MTGPARGPVGEVVASGPPYGEVDMVPPDGSVLLICRDCCADRPTDAVVIVFPGASVRARWVAGHNADTGHARLWSFDGALSHRGALAVFSADLTMEQTLRSGRAVPDQPTADEVVNKLADHATRPEWNVSLGHAEVLVLLARFDDLTAVAVAAAEVYDEGLDGVVSGHDRLGVALAALRGDPDA